MRTRSRPPFHNGGYTRKDQRHRIPTGRNQRRFGGAGEEIFPDGLWLRENSIIENRKLNFRFSRI
jgi:hypothetical protein